MRRSWQSYAGATALATLAIVIACSDSTPVGPEVPVPSFQIAACGEWSCAIADCNNDPAIYGACCVAAADDGQSPAPRPSCGSPYCQTYPDRCSGEPGVPAGSQDTVPRWCYHSDAGDVCDDPYWQEEHEPWECPNQPTGWDDFAECWAQ